MTDNTRIFGALLGMVLGVAIVCLLALAGCHPCSGLMRTQPGIYVGPCAPKAPAPPLARP